MNLSYSIMLYVTLLLVIPASLTSVAIQESTLKRIYEILMHPNKEDGCDKAMLNLVMESGNRALMPFIMNSAKGINDMGDMDACMTTPSVTRFITLHIRFLPVALAFGFCLPRACTASSLSGLSVPIAEQITKLANELKRQQHC